MEGFGLVNTYSAMLIVAYHGAWVISVSLNCRIPYDQRVICFYISNFCNFVLCGNEKIVSSAYIMFMIM